MQTTARNRDRLILTAQRNLSPISATKPTARELQPNWTRHPRSHSTLKFFKKAYRSQYPALRLASWLPAALFNHCSAPWLQHAIASRSRVWSRSLRVGPRLSYCKSELVYSPARQCGAPATKICTHFIENIHSYSRLYDHDTATPAMKFVAVCGNANLPLPTSKPRQQASLKDPGAVTPAPASAPK
jgi:hypothetical protein